MRHPAKSPEIRAVGSQSGRNDAGTDPFGPNRIELLVTRSLTSNGPPAGQSRLINDLSKRLPDNSGATFNITQPIIDTSPRS